MPAPPPESRAGDDKDAAAMAVIRAACTSARDCDTAHDLVRRLHAPGASSSPSAMTRIERLGAGLADQQAPGPVRGAPRPSAMHRGHARVLERLAAARSARSSDSAAPARTAAATSLAGLPSLDQHGQHLQRRDQAVAGGGEIARG